LSTEAAASSTMIEMMMPGSRIGGRSRLTLAGQK
jgi:hypothetical protein